MKWFEGLLSGNSNSSVLNIDEAFLNITTDSPFHIYELLDECYKCPFSYLKWINISQVLRVSAKYGTSWRLYRDTTTPILSDNQQDGLICEVRPKNFGEFGTYTLSYLKGKCEIVTTKQPVNIYLPLLVICFALFIAAVICSVGSFIRIRLRKKSTITQAGNKLNKRVTAIDAFRGISLVVMMFVNDRAGEYAFLNHSTWNGLNVADLLFPWFIWIMGVCIPISIKSQLKKNITRPQLLLSILQRSSMLFILGLVLSTLGVGPELNSIRIFGVLQRIGIAYFVVASLVTLLMLQNIDSEEEKISPVADISSLFLIWILMFILVAAQSYLTFYFPVPGCPTGYLGPGGIHYNGIYRNCTGGTAGYFDKLILSKKHLFQNPTSNAIYHSGPFDPEGPFGCILSSFQAFLGVQAGAIITNYSKPEQRMRRWLIWGALLGIFGLVLCQGRQEGGWIPLNKNLWSLSYVAVTSSLGFFILCFLNYVIDIKRWWSGSPFIYPGMNAILIYVGSEVTYNLFPWHWQLGIIRTHFISTIEALWGTFLWTFISYMLFRKNFFLSL